MLAVKEKEAEVASGGEAKKEEIPLFQPNVETLPSHLRLLYALIKVSLSLNVIEHFQYLWVIIFNIHDLLFSVFTIKL